MLCFGKGTSNDGEDHLFYTCWNSIKTRILVSFLVASTDRSWIRNGITVQAVTVEKVSTYSMFLKAATRPFFLNSEKSGRSTKRETRTSAREKSCVSALARVCHCTSLTPKWLVHFDLDSDSPAQFSMGWFKSLLIFFSLSFGLLSDCFCAGPYY